VFWAAIASLCLLPATVAPLGFSTTGLPIGVQIVRPLYGDRTTIEVARMLEHAWETAELTYRHGLPAPDGRRIGIRG
jgi:Asp-tRNA(Asn)/Glu-tRNA(Gln) amidotransferase A subunit family amidase